MLTSELAMSEFTSSQFIDDTENQSNSSQRKYFILIWKLIYFLEIECKTNTLSIIIINIPNTYYVLYFAYI